MAPTNIQTQRPPELDFSIENLKKLLAGGPEEQRSIDRLGSSMREFASRGKQALTPGQVARGVSGTGVANRQYSNVEDKANQLFAGGSADIEMDRLDKRHGVLRDIAGLGTTAASIAQGDRAAALSQYDRQLDAWRAESANAMAQKNAQLSELSTIVNLMGGMNPSYAGVF